MRLVFLLAIIAAFGLVNAYSNLAPGYFLYNNITLGAGSSIIAAVNTSGPVKLIVIKPSDLQAYTNGASVNMLYDTQVGTGIYKIALPAGTYTVIFQAISAVQLVSGAVASGSSSYSKEVELTGPYSYTFSLSNYSNVNVTLLSTSDFRNDPMSLNLSAYPLSIFSDTNEQSYSVTLNRGTYTLGLTAATPTDVFVMINSTSVLVDPLQNFSYSTQYPIGVVSYGIYNDSTRTVPYQVSTSQIDGTANISALAAAITNASLIQADNLSANGASLQLNVQMNTYVGGRPLVYWLQDVVDFNTSQRTFYLIDNIWNNTNPDANLTNATLIGGGNVTSCFNCTQTFYADTYPAGLVNYSLPLDIKLVMLENRTANGTVMSFGYQILRNGTQAEQPLVFYDRVLVPGAYNSTILVTPYYLTPSVNQTSNYYNAELIFGGEGSGSTSYFNAINASMWIYYLKNGTLVPFPTAYTFGYNTAESAENIRMVPYEYGAIATTGAPNFSEQLVASDALGALAYELYNTSKYTAPSTVYVSTAAPLINIPGVQVPENYLYIILVVLIVLIVIVILAGRKRKN